MSPFGLGNSDDLTLNLDPPRPSVYSVSTDRSTQGPSQVWNGPVLDTGQERRDLYRGEDCKRLTCDSRGWVENLPKVVVYDLAKKVAVLRDLHQTPSSTPSDSGSPLHPSFLLKESGRDPWGIRGVWDEKER